MTFGQTDLGSFNVQLINGLVIILALLRRRWNQKRYRVWSNATFGYCRHNSGFEPVSSLQNANMQGNSAKKQRAPA